METENGVWKLTINGTKKFIFDPHDTIYTIENQKQYRELSPLVKIKLDIKAILLNNFLVIDQAETSVNVQAKLCGVWHTHTLGLTSIEATL